MAQYQQREKYYAHKYIRLLTKTAAAQELGPSVCWLLAVVAMQEDSKRYTEPAKWYLDQLAPLCGFSSKQTLVTAISKAQSEGWLLYEAGGKGRPGRFSVSIPEQFLHLDDRQCDESEPISVPIFGTQSIDPVQKMEQKQNANGMQTECKGIASIPIPVPKPKDRFEPSKVELPKTLETNEFRAVWSQWCSHRAEIKKPLTETQVEKQLTKFAKWGVKRSIAAIDHTVEQGWVGIREADNQKTRQDDDHPMYRKLAQ